MSIYPYLLNRCIGRKSSLFEGRFKGTTSRVTLLMSAAKPADRVETGLVSVRYKNIPEYLHCTAFYRALNSDDESELEIPANCFWAGGAMRTDGDFRMYLQTQLFWGSSSMTLDALQFCFQQSEESKGQYSADHLLHSFGIIHDVFGEESSLLRSLSMMLFNCDFTFSSLSTDIISSTLKSVYCNRSHVQILFDFYAVTNGGGPITSLVDQFGLNGDELTCLCAARNGNFKYVQYFIDNGCPWDFGTCYFAAMHGRTDILRNALNAETPPKAHAIYRWQEVAAVAAEFGHLNCLQFMYEHNYPWDVWACTAAAGGNDLTILEFLVNRDCPFSKDTLANAVLKGSFENVQYLVEKGCPRIDELCVQGDLAERCGFLLIMTVLWMKPFAPMHQLWRP